jgi:hypothetical protein
MSPERDLALRYEVEDQSSHLIDLAEQAVRNVKNVELRIDQVRGLLRQAQAGQGVEHLCNWLRYQWARVREWQTSGLAEVILGDARTLKEDARTIAGFLYPGRAEEQQGVVWSALVRCYAAYVERWYRVVHKERGGQ